MRGVTSWSVLLLALLTVACDGESAPEPIEAFSFHELESAVWTRLNNAGPSSATSVLDLAPEELEGVRVLRYAANSARKRPGQEIILMCQAERKETGERVPFGAALVVQGVSGGNVSWSPSGSILLNVVAENRWSEFVNRDGGYVRENPAAAP